ncbi:TolC family protein [Flavobacteriaceae bacterium]|nr:TolC family protein [Flavobacteriaceae bacterium]MDB4186572.1 TolC family protein [Flavobacteriaceae bacterium]MDB9821551.1 TolC family protein [Flavobacteriaceae bacterium]
MKNTAQSLTALFLLFSTIVFGQTKQWTLEECVELALEKNITIKQSELDYVNAQIDKQATIAGFFPRVNSNLSHSWNIGLNQNITTGLLENLTTQFSSAGVNLGIDIYKGKQNFNQLHRANLTLLARQYQLADISNDISLLVANSFLQIMFNREILSVQQAQLAVSKAELERTMELISAGVLVAGDVFELEATIATQEQAVVQADNTLRLAKINLAQLLLITDYENFDISFMELDVPFSQVMGESTKKIYEKALTIRDDIKLAVTNVEIAETNVALAKGTLQPSLSAFYGYSTRLSYSDRTEGTGEFTEFPIGFVRSDGSEVYTTRENRRVIGPLPIADQLGINDGHNFGLQLSIPIFNGLSAKSNVKRNKVNLERTKNSLEQQQLDLESAINQAYNDAKGAYTFYEAAKKTTQARMDAFDDAQKRYEAGVMNSFNYTQIKQRYDAAVSDEVRAKYDYIFKLKVVEFYFGVPLSF